MKNPPNRNRHHLIPRVRHGQNLDSNLILIDMVKHKNWHKMWQNRTLLEIIRLLELVDEKKFNPSPQWGNIFGKKSLEEAIELLKRVYSIKKAQEEHYFW